MRRITNPKHPNVDQVGTDVEYEGELHRITDVGGSYFTLVRHRDAYGKNVKIREINGDCPSVTIRTCTTPGRVRGAGFCSFRGGSPLAKRPRQPRHFARQRPFDFMEFAMTERSIPVDAFGPIALDLTMNTGSICVVVDPTIKRAQMALKTGATSGPSADAIRDTTVSLAGQNLMVRVPDVPGGAGGSTTINMGGSTMTFSGGSGVQIVGGNVHISGHGGGKVFVNGREVTATSPASDALTPIRAEILLPAKSVLLLRTHTADTVIKGALARLEYDAKSGSVTAERVGDLNATITSGSVIVGEVTGPLDVNLTSGHLGIGAYSGHHARLNLTSGNVQMAATPRASGRLAVGATSGCVRITGAAHLDVRRRVTSGYVQIS
ncbi:DUF4097 family beta strand repeat-containing protein [Streptomyces sp. NPDC087305]|uniref:DUF4097 family beta strand repeat-containing protein n=1 Tax=Streptomyces sp. NPDC087305 TaxID=3365781 RepID=UPI003830E214